MDAILLNIVNGIAFGMLLFLLASGLSVMLGLMGIINLAHGILFMIGAFIGWTVLVQYKLNFGLAILAGGLGAGLMAFLGARLVRGFDMVAECVKLEEEIRMADLVITGEGKMDRQTLFGKTPCGVAQLAVKYGKPVISVTGSLDDETGELGTSAFTAIIPILEKPSDLVYAMEHAPDLLERTGTRIARMISAFR